MSDDSGHAGSSFFTLLGLLFIGLKLGGVIDWEWWLVLLPLWGPTAFLILVYAVYCAYMALYNRFNGDRWDRW